MKKTNIFIEEKEKIKQNYMYPFCSTTPKSDSLLEAFLIFNKLSLMKFRVNNTNPTYEVVMLCIVFKRGGLISFHSSFNC